eukprot:2375338-Lingulodinium_polyedra.AAC.1
MRGCFAVGLLWQWREVIHLHCALALILAGALGKQSANVGWCYAHTVSGLAGLWPQRKRVAKG